METPTLNMINEVLNIVGYEPNVDTRPIINDLIGDLGLENYTSDQLAAAGELMAVVTNVICKAEFFGWDKQVKPSKMVALYCQAIKIQLDALKEVESLVED